MIRQDLGIVAVEGRGVNSLRECVWSWELSAGHGATALARSRLLLQMINLRITEPRGYLPTPELCCCGPNGKLTQKHLAPYEGQRAS